MTRRQVPKEDKPIPGATMDGWLAGLSEAEVRMTMDRWRLRGLSDTEVQRVVRLCDDAFNLRAKDDPITTIISGVLDLQRQRGEKLRDLTWTQALEAFIEDRRRDLDEAVELIREFGEKDPDREPEMRGILRALGADGGDPITTTDVDLELAKRRILKALQRACEVHQEWLKLRESGLRGHLLEIYRTKVRGYYGDDEAFRRKETTPRARRQARALKDELDGDTDVIALRKKLHIPDDGFQDVDQAACWLYDRYPAVEGLAPHGPVGSSHPYGKGPRYLFVPAIMQVSVLAEAARRLRQDYEKKHKLDPAWDFVLCFYLLRGKLDARSRQRYPRKRPMEEVYQEIGDLMEKYRPCFKAVMFFKYRLTEADWSQIAKAEEAANKIHISREAKDSIERQARRIAESKGPLDPERLYFSSRFEQRFYEVRSRIKHEKKT